MAIRSGLGSQIGFAKETTWGTRVAPTRFVPFNSESLVLTKNFLASQGLRSGRMFQASGLHVATTRTVEGSVEFELLTKGMGLFFDQLHDNAVAPVQVGATTAYEQTHNIGTTAPEKSFTIQVGRPDTGGTVRPFDLLGCVTTAWSLAVDAQGLATCSFTYDGKDEDTAQTLATATYAAGVTPFHFAQGTVKVDDVAIGNVRTVTVNGTLPRAVDRYHLGSLGTKDKPATNAYNTATAETTLEFASLADHNRFKNETVVKLDLEFVGPLIEAGHNYTLRVTLNDAKQIGSGPVVSGPDILTTPASFEALDDGVVAPVAIYLKSTDSAL